PPPAERTQSLKRNLYAFALPLAQRHVPASELPEMRWQAKPPGVVKRVAIEPLCRRRSRAAAAHVIPLAEVTWTLKSTSELHVRAGAGGASARVVAAPAGAMAIGARTARPYTGRSCPASPPPPTTSPPACARSDTCPARRPRS